MEAYDPLADAPPPRYAVESDDEDEYNPTPIPSAGSEQPPEVKIEVRSIYDTPQGRPLIFASGEASLSWAKIVNLGEQQAGVYANDLLIGLLFHPSWTSAVIIMSEADMHARLPFFAMAKYTTTIIRHLQPTSVAILDSYSTKVYVSSRAIPQETAPIRYLSIKEITVPDPGLELLTPPNLLQSTTASLLNELFLRSLSQDSTEAVVATILLPSPKVPRPPPTTLNGSGVSGDYVDTNWERETLERAHKCLFAIVGEEVDRSSLYVRADAETRPSVFAGIPRRSTVDEVGEGGMYI